MMTMDDKDKHRELRLKGFAYLKLGLQRTQCPRSRGTSDLQYMSWARPFHDLCCRDHVFLVIVVFKFEFVE